MTGKLTDCEIVVCLPEAVCITSLSNTQVKKFATHARYPIIRRENHVDMKIYFNLY